jgi:hypothetical protein
VWMCVGVCACVCALSMCVCVYVCMRVHACVTFTGPEVALGGANFLAGAAALHEATPNN